MLKKKELRVIKNSRLFIIIMLFIVLLSFSITSCSKKTTKADNLVDPSNPLNGRWWSRVLDDLVIELTLNNGSFLISLDDGYVGYNGPFLRGTYTTNTYNDRYTETVSEVHGGSADGLDSRWYSKEEIQVYNPYWAETLFLIKTFPYLLNDNTLIINGYWLGGDDTTFTRL